MMLPTKDKEALLTKQDIEQAIKSDKHRIYDMPVTITPRDFVIAKAQIAKLEKLGYHKDEPPKKVNLNDNDFIDLESNPAFGGIPK